MTEWLGELRHTLRTLARQPGFVLVAVVTTALGVGANVAIFSVVQALLLRPLPYRAPGELAWITNVVQNFRAEIVSGADYLDWRERARTLSSLAAFTDPSGNTLDLPDRPERAIETRVSPNFLETFGVRPRVGRDFVAADAQLNAPPVAIVTPALWRRVFGEAVTFDGTHTLRMGEDLVTVVGVLPEGFLFPQQPRVEILRPLQLDEAVERGRRRMSIVHTVGRVRPGVSLVQVQSELTTIQKQAEAAAESAAPPAGGGPLPGGPMGPGGPGGPGGGGGGGQIAIQQGPPPGGPGGPAGPGGPRPRRIRPETYVQVTSLQDRLVGDVRSQLIALLVTVGFVLLIACANLANLALARATSRHRELTIRAALGASRRRLVRHLLFESTTIALAGGVVGVLLGAWLDSVLLALVPRGIASGLFVQVPIGLNLPVLFFALAVSILAGVLVGLAPAIMASRFDLNDALKTGGQATTGTVTRARFRAVLVAAEVGLAVVLLVGATLLVRSFARLLSVDPGFHPEGVTTFAIDLDGDQYDNPDAARTFYRSLAERVSGIPGVTVSGYGDTIPFNDYSMIVRGISLEDATPPPGQPPEIAITSTSPGYFRAMGVSIVRGRPFTDADRDGAPGAVIVNQAMARQFWGDRNPVGKHIQIGPRQPMPMTIVGVAADTRHDGLGAEVRPAMYRPFDQAPLRSGFLVVRSTLAQAGLVDAVRSAVHDLDAHLVVYDVAGMDHRLAESLAPRRFAMLLLASFAALALCLSGIGLYGVIAYLVGERTREIGIRMALGAEARQIASLVGRQAGWMVGAGLVSGLLAAWALGPVMARALFQVTSHDVASFATVPVVVTAVALVACLVPALRAARVDPAITLRE